MFDIAQREIAHRGIVLCLTDSFGLQFGIVDLIDEDNYAVVAIVVYQGGFEEAVRIENAPSNIFNVAHRQLPKAIKDRLIELSGERIHIPNQLRTLTDGRSEIIVECERPLLHADGTPKSLAEARIGTNG